MFRNYLQNGVKYSFLSISNLLGGDKLDNKTPTEKAAAADKTESKNENESGWTRVKQLFKVDEFGNITPEANSILQVGAMSIFVGAIYGGVINSRAAYLEFMRNNVATSFRTHFEAKEKLQNKVTISFGKGAFKWSWRLTLFTTTFVGVSTIIQTYRGKYGILEYIAAGGITGALYKFNMGPRGWIVGGGLGSALGLFCGGVSYGLLKIAGISMAEVRYWQNSLRQSRNEYLRKGMADYFEKEDFAVIKLHNDEVGKSGKDISNLDTNVKDR